MTAVSLTFALAQVYFGPLDAGEDLVEERLVLGLLALVLQERRRAGESAAGRDARGGAVSGLDGFVTVLVGGLLAALQQLIILHLRDIILIKRKSQNCVRIFPRVRHLQRAVLRVHLVEQRDAPPFHRLRPPDAELLVAAADIVRPQKAVAVASLPAVPRWLLLFLHRLAKGGAFLRDEEHCVGHQHVLRPSDAGGGRDRKGRTGGNGRVGGKHSESVGPPPVGAIRSPLKLQLLHLSLQLLLSGPAAIQQGQPLFQTSVLLDRQLHLLFRRLPSAPLRGYLAVEGLNGALQGGVLFLWVWTRFSPAGRGLLRPESIQEWNTVGGTGRGLK